MREHKRWEKISNRRSPLTLRMIKTFFNYRNDHPDTLKVALIDWLVLATYLGPRKSEWCQNASHLRNHRTFTKNIDGSCQAFTLEDLEFLGEGNKKINIKNINSHNVCAEKKSLEIPKEWQQWSKFDLFQKLKQNVSVPGVSHP